MNLSSVRLQDVAEIVSGSTPSRNILNYWGGEIAWVTPKDLSNLSSKYIDSTPEKISREGLNSCSATILPINSVLLSSRAPIGHVAITKIPMATNQGFKSFIPKKDKLDSSYLYYWLRHKKKFLQSLGRGATFKEISKSIVEKIEIPLPPLDEQERIVAILDEADELHMSRQRAFERLEGLVRSVFFDMFGDPVRNEKEWKKVRVGEISEVVSKGTTPTTHGVAFINSGIPFLRAEDIVGRAIDIKTVKHYVDEKTHSTLLARSRLKPGDFLITIAGSLGRVGYVPLNAPPLNCNQAVAFIRLKRNIIDLNYVLHVFQNEGLIKSLLNIQKIGTIGNLNLEQIRNFKIPIPPLGVQQVFSKFAGKAGLIRDLLYATLKKTEMLQSSLSAHYFE